MLGAEYSVPALHDGENHFGMTKPPRFSNVNMKTPNMTVTRKLIQGPVFRDLLSLLPDTQY
jgi:hypothetical protein